MTATDTIDLLDQPLAGSRMGKYEIVRRLAFGGMAEIYLARASGLQGFEKYVVLKRILPQYAADMEFVRMFVREAKLAATLDQANIAHVYDIGHVGGSYFYTMEYLHGEDLRAMMRSLKHRELRLPLEHAIEIVLSAASGLHYAHEKKGTDGRGLGIVHRDVSPSNIFVTFDGGVKIVDFGIAKVTTDPDLSRGESFKGKLSYMSPEQVDLRPIDRRSDVFALGVVLHEITTHRRLFSGATDVEVVKQMLSGGIARPSLRDPTYPAELERIVMRALEHDPNLRYATVREMQRDLEIFARTHDVPVSSTALAEWMELTFGPKREAWHERPPATLMPVMVPEAPEAQPAPTERSGPTKLVGPRADIAAAARATVAAREDLHEQEKTPPPVAVPAPPPVAVPAPVVGMPSATLVVVSPPTRPVPSGARRSRRHALRIAAASALLVAAVAVTVGLTRPRASTPVATEARPASPVVMLVAEGGNVAIEPAGEAPGAPTASPAAPVSPVAVAPRTQASRGGRRHAGTGGSRPLEFSASLARRERDLRACFEGAGAHGADGAPEIAFRFQIRADGRVALVDVLPESVGSTRLGACLRHVGMATVFAPQPEPVTVRIPVSLKLRTTGTPGKTVTARETVR